ncbi:MAG: amidohydrolase family protein [Halobacteriota archaeon]
MDEYVVGGTVLYGRDLELVTGYVHVERGRIAEVEERSTVECQECRASGVVIPSLINAHTHLGDSIIKDIPFDSLDKLVRPPDSVKHRALRMASTEVLVQAMRRSLMDAASTGTSLLADFREGGINGINALKTAQNSLKTVQVLIFGRPNDTRDYIVEEEIDTVLDNAQGLGLSGTNDFSSSIISYIVKRAQKRGKLVAIHAGEKDSSDVDLAVALDPDYLIHMTHASKHQIESSIPIVVCPRSNLMTGVGSSFRNPPIAQMLESTIVGLGTDNVMLNSVNMFAEMEFVSKAYLRDDRKVLEMATINNAKILQLDHEVGSIETGKRADLLIINDKSDNLCGTRNIISSIVRRARPDDIVCSLQSEAHETLPRVHLQKKRAG